MTTQTEKMEFQAETQKLLDLMIHSLYRQKEIFLRELISNASDALDKVRFQAITDSSILEDDDRLHIRIEPDSEDGTLLIADNGIGMSREDVIQNLGTIARSGTQAFMKEMKAAMEKGAEAPELIGQFGVGFYSAFMVADEVQVDTRRYDEKTGIRWTSTGDGTFTVTEVDKPDRGTTILLRLKKKSPEDESFQDFGTEWLVRETVKRYSDFVAYPIEMEVEREEEHDGKKEKIRRIDTLNSMKPLWTKSPADVTEEEHADFYRHLTHDWEKPRKSIHFRAEGTLEYTALLYLPSHKPFMMAEGREPKSQVSLYVKRVFIMDDCDELLPPWLRFIRGLVDSNDLPLNVSRETLQHARQMTPIRKRLTGKALETLKAMLKDEREEYEALFNDFGSILKEGIYYDPEQKTAVAEITLFSSTAGDARCTLGEYVARMPESQKEIYFLAGTDKAAMLRSPHLEAFKKKGFEVLLLTDPVDEFAMQRLETFEDKPIKSIERGEVDLEEAEEKKAREEKEADLKPLIERVKEALKDDVGDVRFSNRLTDSAAVLVTGEDDLTPQMKRVLREARQEVPESKRILELNREHALVTRLDAIKDDESTLADYCQLLFGQALLAEGSPLKDPVRFNQIVAGLMVRGG